MNREDIIRMAREAGFVPPDGIFATWDASDEQIERFAKLVAEQAKAEEREICAKICEDFSDTDSYDGGITTEYHAILIRARGDKHD